MARQLAASGLLEFVFVRRDGFAHHRRMAGLHGYYKIALEEYAARPPPAAGAPSDPSDGAGAIVGAKPAAERTPPQRRLFQASTMTRGRSPPRSPAWHASRQAVQAMLVELDVEPRANHTALADLSALRVVRAPLRSPLTAFVCRRSTRRPTCSAARKSSSARRRCSSSTRAAQSRVTLIR